MVKLTRMQKRKIVQNIADSDINNYEVKREKVILDFLRFWAGFVIEHYLTGVSFT